MRKNLDDAKMAHKWSKIAYVYPWSKTASLVILSFFIESKLINLAENILDNLWQFLFSMSCKICIYH